MREVTYTKYFAFDDTEFESKNECLKYERQVKNSFIMFDRLGKAVNYMDDCHILYVKTAEGAHYLYSQYEASNYLPWNDDWNCCPGLWFWNFENSEWTDASDVFSAFGAIKKAIEALEKEEEETTDDVVQSNP